LRRSYLRLFRQRPLQTSAFGRPLKGPPQTAHGRVGNGCSSRYSLRAIARACRGADSTSWVSLDVDPTPGPAAYRGRLTASKEVSGPL